jgi:hypothetical protein
MSEQAPDIMVEADGRAESTTVLSSEDPLVISLADFGLIRSRAIVGKGCIGWGRVS